MVSMSVSTISVQECTAAEYQQALMQLEQKQPTSVSFLQSLVYARLQELIGRQVVYVIGSAANVPVACGVGICYQLPGGLRYLYFPYGPVVTENVVYTALSSAILPIARRLGCAFVRIDNDRWLTTLNLKPAPNDISRLSSLQPRAEWVLDINQDTQAVWMGMHKHARYNVRLAERANASYKQFAPAEAPFDEFIGLMQTTSDRDNFSLHDEAYYRAMLNAMSPKDGFVAIVYINDAPAAAALFVVHDNQLHYVFAGSSNDYRKIAPAYFLLWNALQHGKRKGCSLLNFGGVQDEVKKLHLQGVTSFKKRFGGYQINHRNPHDIIVSPFKYALLRLYKRIR